MTRNPAHMWRYWRDDKGVKAALRDYYPDHLAANHKLAAALAQIENAEAAIDAEFVHLSDFEGEE